MVYSLLIACSILSCHTTCNQSILLKNLFLTPNNKYYNLDLKETDKNNINENHKNIKKIDNNPMMKETDNNNIKEIDNNPTIKETDKNNIKEIDNNPMIKETKMTLIKKIKLINPTMKNLNAKKKSELLEIYKKIQNDYIYKS